MCNDRSLNLIGSNGRPDIHITLYLYLVAKSCLTLGTHGLYVACQGFPGKNTGEGCHSFSKRLSQPRDRTHVSFIGR